MSLAPLMADRINGEGDMPNKDGVNKKAHMTSCGPSVPVHGNSRPTAIPIKTGQMRLQESGSMRCGPTNGVQETLTDPSLRQGGLDLLKVVLAIRDERFQIPQQGVNEDLPLGPTPRW